MNWDAVAAMGQAVSAFALVFVLVQVRHAREEMQLSARLTRLQGAREWQMMVATSPDLSSLAYRMYSKEFRGEPSSFVKYASEAGLTPAETMRFASVTFANWFVIEAGIESV